MLEFYYKERRTLVDFRRGPLGPYFDGFAAHLKKSGFAYDTARARLGKCCLFNTFLIEQGISHAKQITPSLMESFLEIYLKHVRGISAHYGRLSAQRDLKNLFDYLVHIEVLQPVVPKPVITRYSWMLEPYLKYLREECERAEKTIQRINNALCLFLEGLGEKVDPKRMKSLEPESIEGYIQKHIHGGQHNLRSVASTLRGFLRFCALRRFTMKDLSGIIPSIPSYRMASLPKGMEESNLEKILKTIDQNTPAGCRDYAIMILLMGYGIRAKQAAELLLDDISWPRSTIRIRAQKGGKEVLLPLLDSVGEAILGYLRHRPESPFRQIFLSGRAPYHPIDGQLISHMVQVYMRKAGVKVPHSGAHTLRHSWAIRALAKDTPMKAIADVLGHRYLDTTFIYAKSDLKTLRHVIMPWPEVKS